MTNYDLYFEWLWENRDELIAESHETQRAALMRQYSNLDLNLADAITRCWYKEARTYD